MNILVINSGSSSIKYQLINIKKEEVLCNGVIERIGLPDSIFTHFYFENGMAQKNKEILYLPSHKEGLEKVASFLQEMDIKAVGHRVVHGGEIFSKTTLVTDEVKKEIEKIFPLAPLHNPANLQGIKVAEKIFKNAKQVVVFDTAFHQSIPQKAYRYAIPQNLYEKAGIRKYGFHGTSHKYVSEQANAHLKNNNTKLITIHLGNGCSMAAIKSGKCIDTSMGMGPLSGLIMGTRCGDLDPSIVFYMAKELGYSVQEVSDILNKKSGMQGLTGFSDMRDIENTVKNGNENSVLALEMYAYKIQKMIGAYAVAMNGLDAIVFTAGVGENDINTRQLICQNLQILGIELDKTKNDQRPKKLLEIQSETSKVKLMIIPTNEELEIAKQTYKLIG